MTNLVKKVFPILTIIFFITINLYLLPSRGTGDLNAHIDRLNLVKNYNWSQFINTCLDFSCFSSLQHLENYPPLTIVLLFFFMKILPYNLIGLHLTVKLTIFLFYILTYIVFIYIYHKINYNNKKINYLNFSVVYFSLVSIILNGQGLGYLDLLNALFLTISLFYLFIDKKYFLSGFMYSLSILIKYQPLILAPVILCYLLLPYLSRNLFHSRRNFWLFLLGLSLPFFILLVINKEAVFYLKNSLIFAVSDSVLSASLNLYWIITYILHLFYSGLYGSYKKDYFNYITIQPQHPLLITGKIILGFVDIFILMKYLFVRKYSPLYTLTAMLIFYLSYFILSPGVHENHNFTAIILAILIYILNPNIYTRINLLIIDIMNFFNMFLFYGINGSRDIIAEILFQVDFTLILSVIFIFVYFIYIYLFFKSRLQYLFNCSSSS